MHKPFYVAAVSVMVAALSLATSDVVQAQGDNTFPTNGSVGIGRTNPVAKLHVRKNANTMALEGQDHSYIEWFPQGLNSGRKGWMGYELQVAEAFIIKNEYADGNILLRTEGGSVGVGTNDPEGGLHVRKNANTLTLEGTGHTYMALFPLGQNSGRRGWVGYGSNGDNNLSVTNENDGADLLLRTNGGSVGVGTQQPLGAMHVRGNGDALNLEGESHTFIAMYPTGQFNGRKGWMGYGNNAATDLSIANEYDNGNILLRTNRGNVGVGTTDPQATMHVRGNGGMVRLEGNGQSFIDFVPRGDNAGRKAWVGFGNANNLDFTIRTMNGFSDIILLPGSKGKVGIGTVDPAYTLDICGEARAKEIVVETGWCDYVFEDDYDLMTLGEVEAYIKEHKHLPNIPPASEVEGQGLKLADMNTRMMEKIEELTLYVIEQNKQIEAMKEELEALKKQ